MIPKELNDWLQVVGLFGVFGGLVLVAFEIHQSGQQLELSALADGTDNFTEAMETLVQDENLSRLIYRAEKSFADLDDFDRWRVSKYLHGYFSVTEQDYLVSRKIDSSVALGIEDDWRENMSLQMYRDYWRRSQDRFGPDFRAFINELLGKLDSH